MLRHETASKQKKVEELQTMYNSMVKDASEAVATDAGESEDAKKYVISRAIRHVNNIPQCNFSLDFP